MKIRDQRAFQNGVVYALETEDGYPIEATDTFLPAYTADAARQGENRLRDGGLGSRRERWMIGVSCMSGCPVGCKFCATGQLKRWRALSAGEIVEQVDFIVKSNPGFHPGEAAEFKINYTRMGEPFLNIGAVREAVERIEAKYPGTHHYISTIGCEGSDFSWIRGNITLQLSLHSLDEERRRDLIPFPRLLSIGELGGIRTGSRRKTTLNLTLVAEEDFDIQALTKHFSPQAFFVKLSPINQNPVSLQNQMGSGVIRSKNLL